MPPIPSRSTCRSSKPRPRQNKARTCEFCSRQFNRDVLRRHYRSCPQRELREIPDQLPRGRKKRACDACTHRKVSCDLDWPCESCLLSGKCCTYHKTKAGRNQASAEDDETSQVQADRETPVWRGAEHSKISIPFILNWIDPNSHLTDTFERLIDTSDGIEVIQSDFDFDTLTQRKEDEALDEEEGELDLDAMLDVDKWILFTPNPSGSVHWTDLMPDEDLSSLFASSADAQIDDSFLQSIDEQWQTDQQIQRQTDHGSHSLRRELANRNVSAELIKELARLTLPFPSDHADHAPSIDLAIGMQMFSQENMARFLQLYFQHWNRHSPVVHRGTFNAANASLALLLSMILTGALFSLSPNEVAVARSMLDLAEEIAFEDQDFLSIASGNFANGKEQSSRALRAVQAAFSIFQVQLREGSTWKRKLIRSARFDQIVYAVRTISIRSVKLHTLRDSTTAAENFDWDQFGEDESRLRLIYGVFNLDVAFAIFYRMSPRIFYHELNTGAPCSDAEFMAETADMCQNSLMESKRHTSSFSQTAMALADGRNDIKSLGSGHSPIYLFSVMFALLQIIHNSKSIDQCAETTELLYSGLQHWKLLWDESLLLADRQQKGAHGFVRNAGVEFWHLACYLIRIRGAETGSLKQCRGSRSYPNPFHDVLQRAKSLA